MDISKIEGFFDETTMIDFTHNKQPYHKIHECSYE